MNESQVTPRKLEHAVIDPVELGKRPAYRNGHGELRRPYDMRERVIALAAAKGVSVDHLRGLAARWGIPWPTELGDMRGQGDGDAQAEAA